VDAPSSAAWVSALCRSWCNVNGPPSTSAVRSSNSSAARRYDSLARLLRQVAAATRRQAGDPAS
jgi:hypothetical protein